MTEPVQGQQSGFPSQRRVKAEAEWSGAIAALNQLLRQTIEADKLIAESAAPAELLHGVLLSGPFPVLLQPELTSRIATWMFTIASPGETLQLLPAEHYKATSDCAKIPTLPLLPHDPLASEQFSLVLTTEFSLVMALGETPEGEPAFLFSFEPEVVRQAWRSLEARLKLAAPQRLADLAQLIEQFPPVAPDYRTVTQFSRLMLANLPHLSELEGRPLVDPQDNVFQAVGKSFRSSLEDKGASDRAASDRAASEKRRDLNPPPRSPRRNSTFNRKPTPDQATQSVVNREEVRSETKSAHLEGADTASPDTELLQAIAHEVRTPLTTIRTLTRLLLRRKDLKPDVIKQLEIIDRECTEQIDRFTLIFRAVELETTNARNLLTSLAPIPLDRVLQQNAPRWQQQASQHNHTLDIILPQKMPLVVTDPAMLDQVLTGLIDRITHSLPPGSHIQVRVSLAGHQLKLQLESHPQANQKSDGSSSNPFQFTPTLKSIGQLLMFQPETGNLSLNMAVTKNLFQALGGKLIVRQRPEQGEVLTIFLPLEMRKE